MSPLTSRRLLQLENISQTASSSLSPTTAVSGVRRPFVPDAHTRFDSYMVLTIIVLFTTFFFMGLFSVYIRRSGRNKEGGVDPAAVNSLPVVAYANANANARMMAEECPICLSDFVEGETVKLIPYCGHVFHIKCVDTWLALHVTCPLCRSHQLFNTDA